MFALTLALIALAGVSVAVFIQQARLGFKAGQGMKAVHAFIAGIGWLTGFALASMDTIPTGTAIVALCVTGIAMFFIAVLDVAIQDRARATA